MNVQKNLAPRLLDALPLACALYDEPTGKLVHANPVFVREFSALGRIESCDVFESHFQEFESTNSDNGLIEVFAPTTSRWYSLRKEHVELLSQERCSLVSANNITEYMDSLRTHQTHQDKLMFTSRMMSVGEMATTLAHELNQPLATVVNCLNVGLRSLQPGADTQRAIDALALARVQAQYAGDVIRHLREFVRSREPKRESFELSGIVSSVVQLLQLEARKQRVTVDVDMPGGLPNIYADRVMVEQVLLNLLKNAIEAMHNTEPDLRRAVISARRSLDGDIEVRVVDRGCGLSDSAEENLFSPFFSTKPDGMGVGLAICRSIIEYHDGRLVFERNPDGGSVFGFALPTVGQSQR